MRIIVIAGVLAITVAVAAQEPPPARVDVEVQYSPYDAVRFALADATAIAATDPAKVKTARYLSLHNFTRAERLNLWRALSFLLNSLSREKLITRPAILGDGVVVRFFLNDYRIDRKQYDRLVERGSGPVDRQFPEPYFSANAVKVTDELIDEYKDVKYGQWNYYTGKYENVHTRREKTGKKVPSGKQRKETVRSITRDLKAADGGAAIRALIDLTHTDNPIIRADWFLAFASWAPAYYDLLGLENTIPKIQAQFGLDVKLIEKLRSDLKDTQLFSGVALNNRTLNRYPLATIPIGGYFWQTHDALKSVGDRDYLANLVNEKFDATEDIWTLFNGLQGYALGDGKGTRLDVAVAGVAPDRETALHDKQISPGRSCIACHARGLRPIEAEVRQLSRGQIGALVTDQKIAERVFDLYFSYDLDPIIKHDQAVFEAAVRQTNDLAPLDNGRLFERIIARYLDAPLTAREIAAEAGVSEPVLLAKLGRAINVPGQLTGLLQVPPRPLRRDQFEEHYGTLQEILNAP